MAARFVLATVVIEGAATEDDGRLAYWVQFLVPADHAERQRFHIDNSNLFGEGTPEACWRR